jgi:DNA topoisomerase-1
MHPETGKVITASIGRYGPYLSHDGKYGRLRSTEEVFETGMNAAVVKLAEAAAGGGARGNRVAAEPLNTFGPHPTSGGEMKLLAGRYGAYVTDGTTNATLPKDTKPEDLTLEQAIALIDARAAAAPAKGKRKKAPAKKAPVKKDAAAKAPAKKAAAKPAAKPAAKKAAPKAKAAAKPKAKPKPKADA